MMSENSYNSLGMISKSFSSYFLNSSCLPFKSEPNVLESYTLNRQPPRVIMKINTDCGRLVRKIGHNQIFAECRCCPNYQWSCRGQHDRSPQRQQPGTCQGPGLPWSETGQFCGIILPFFPPPKKCPAIFDHLFSVS